MTGSSRPLLLRTALLAAAAAATVGAAPAAAGTVTIAVTGAPAALAIAGSEAVDAIVLADGPAGSVASSQAPTPRSRWLRVTLAPPRAASPPTGAPTIAR